MKHFYSNCIALLLLIPSGFAQKSQIKEAQKELKVGNYEQTIAILKPVEYLISNAPFEDRIHFYYTQGKALVSLADSNINASKNLSKAILAFNDLIQVESEANEYKFTSEAVATLKRIKDNLVISANEDFATEKFTESSNKFHQAYLIDKKDTLQLYNAAISYNKAEDIDLALECFEELKAKNYNGNTIVYVAYNKQLLVDEYFATVEERDSKIQSGTHMRPSQKIFSKKWEIYKNIALIYNLKGFKEKAIKAIDAAQRFNSDDEPLAILEAKLYLETKDYESFDDLAIKILESNPGNANLAFNFGLNCEKELYLEGAQKYYKKAIAMDPLYALPYINLSALLIERSNAIDSKIKGLGNSLANKKEVDDLKLEKTEMLKSIYPYLEKAVSIDPLNDNAKQLMASVNMVNNVKTKAFAAGE